MRKISLYLISLIICQISNAQDLSIFQTSSLAAFQKFDNEYYLGYGLSYGNLKNMYGQNSNFGTTYIALGVERLFAIGLWGRVDASLMTGYSNFNSSDPNAFATPLGLDPSIANFNLKLGYGFSLIPATLLITPYALVGRNTNLTANTLNNNQSINNGIAYSDANVTQDYFLTSGLGGRLEYLINNTIELYYDQNALYNSDRSNPNSSYNPVSNYQMTSTIGAKFNLWKQLQLGVTSFYTYTQLANSSSTRANQPFQFYPQHQIGGYMSLGLSY